MKLHDWTNEQRGRSLWLAGALGITPPVVSDWCTGKKQVPVERCAAIERATQGAVTRRDLRPDDYLDIWPELAHTQAQAIAPPAARYIQPDDERDEILPPEKTVPREVVPDRGAPGSDFEPLPTQVDRRDPDAPLDRRAWNESEANQERTLALAKTKAGQGV